MLCVGRYFKSYMYNNWIHHTQTESDLYSYSTYYMTSLLFIYQKSLKPALKKLFSVQNKLWICVSVLNSQWNFKAFKEGFIRLQCQFTSKVQRFHIHCKNSFGIINRIICFYKESHHTVDRNKVYLDSVIKTKTSILV